MKKFYAIRLVILIAILFGGNQGIRAQTVVYSQTFSAGVAPSGTQCSAWQTFQASLLSSLNYTSFNVSGNLNTTGYTCTNPAVTAAVAAALRTGTATTQTSDGHTWYVGTCGSSCENPGIELSVDQISCQCSGGVASVRPSIGNSNWGGITPAGLGCSPPGPQTITVTFFYQALLFTAASPQSLPSACQNSGPISLNSMLSTTNPTTGVTETWSVNAPAVHGTLGGFPVSATILSTSSLTPPGSLSYTPTPGYSGLDSFKIQASAGTSTAIMRVLVTVNATPSPIAGISCAVVGQTTALSDPSGLGVWSSSNTSVATVTSSGLVSGVSTGTTTISYLVGSICPATRVLTVSTTPSAITGPSSICTGVASTLTESAFGGSWSSSNTSFATVDAFGNVTGIAIGGATITYTDPSTCVATKTLTINNSPAPILGTATVCQLGTTSLTDAIGPGVWTSSVLGVANVDGFGNVTGAGTSSTPQTSTIVYTLTNGCTATRIVTVNPLPAPFAVSGNSSFCAGSSPTTNILLIGSAAGISYQLFNGPTAIGLPINGGTGALNFGLPPSAGTYTVVGTNLTTGCVNTMNLSATVSIKPLPAQFTVTSSGTSFCYGGSVSVGLSGSVSGVSYTLYLNGSSTFETIPGNGSAISFGLQSLPGNYTVVASTTGAAPVCTNNMIGSVSITVNPLPDIENVTGGGTYCDGDAGVPIGLDFSTPGISYQLFDGGTPGPIVTGTGGPISFGFQTDPGFSYVVVGTNVITGCTNNMSGIASVSVAVPPTPYNVSGGGADCAGTGFPVGMATSDPGVDYQLYNGAATVGSPMPGISGSFDFGTFTVAGTYSVIATDQVSHCTSNMINTVTITENALPTVYTVSGGGDYCAGGAGLPVMLSGSQVGVTYYLYNGAALAGTLPGTGGSLNFGNQLVGGSYTVVAVDQTTFCTSNMAGNAAITVDPLPSAYHVTGGGSYCAGDAGIRIGLDFSTPGITYQLFNGATPVGGAIPGTGTVLDFGYHTPSGTYSVVAINPSTTCRANMSGNAIISINPLPLPFAVSGGGSYCAGDAGRLVNMGGSEEDISYQLYNAGVATGASVIGAGSSFDFGSQTLPGAYTVVATNTSTSCTKAMPGVATIVVNPAPATYTVTGGGVYCEGGTGRHVGLTGSNAGIHYLLYNGLTLVTTLTGAGSALDFGSEITPGTYTVVATNVLTGCSKTMADNAVIATNAVPTVYTVIGGGSYCGGSTVLPSVGLGSSNAGINYQLYRGGAATGVAIPGTGAAIDFGAQSVGGIYTVVATDATSGCTKNMAGSATVSISAMPTVYAVTGGGNYCIGGAGYHVYMSNSTPGILYKLFNGSTPAGSILGTGAGVDFGLQTLAGTYTAIAENTVSGCTANMAGSAVISISSLPAVHAVTVAGTGNYCVTSPGVHVNLDGSNSGVNYQLYNSGLAVGSTVSGTGSAIDLGLRTAGSYTVIATNASTGCTSDMTGTGVINAIPMPNVYSMTGGGNYCSTGLGLNIGLSGSDVGTMYQLYKGATAFGSAVSGSGSTIDFGLFTGSGSYTVVASNGGALACNSNMAGTAVITVYPVVVPTVNMTTAGGDTVCAGIPAHFSATSINGGASPTYNWSVNGTHMASGSAFSYTATDGDMVTVTLHSNGICAIPDTASQTHVLTVSIPQAPSVHIAATPGNAVCVGTSVTYTGTPMYGGSHPEYTWVKNGTYVVGSGPTYSYIPSDGDIMVVLMGSSFPCRLLDSVFSNTITMEVDPSVIPTVAISAFPGTQVAPGQGITLTAFATGAGSLATYQWLRNGMAIPGATNASYSGIFSNNDSISCEVKGGCDLKGFNSVVISVGTDGVQQLSGAGVEDIKLVPNPNKGVFTIKGMLGTGNEDVTIEVVDMLGQVIYTANATTRNGSINEQIQLSNTLANGMYLLHLRSGLHDGVLHFAVEQ